MHPSPALFDSLMDHILLTPAGSFLSDRTNITEGGAQKDRTDKRREPGSDGCGVCSTALHALYGAVVGAQSHRKTW